MEKVFLSNGEEVELLATYQNGKITKYVVKVAIGENCYDCYEEQDEIIYEDRIVSNIYENYKDIPEFLRKIGFEKDVEKLTKQVKELQEQKDKLTKEMKGIYNPLYPIGTKVFVLVWGRVEESEVRKITFIEEKDSNNYIYGEEYRNFSQIGNGYYLTREEAEKAKQEYLKKQETEKKEKIKKEYEQAKAEYEKLIN